MRLPDFLIIGGMRCGTTSLFELLRSQKSIYLPEKKELHFFDGRVPELSTTQAYAALFAPALETQCCGEATPDYLTTAGCDTAIHDLLPEAKLIVILRDPVARAWSHYQFSCFHHVEAEPLKRALLLEEERLATATAHSDIFFSYQQRGRYIEHLRRYEALFSRSRIHVVLLDELVKNTAQVLSRIMSFLDCEIDTDPDISQLPSLNRTSVYRAVAESSEPKGFWKRLQMGRLRKADRPPYRERTYLRRYFAPYNRELEMWLGRPLPW